VTTDQFLQFERLNRNQYPNLKPTADRLRLAVPPVLKWADASLRQYKQGKTDPQRAALVAAVAGVETLLRTAQSAAVTLPAFQPPAP
jgi:hypothetical protein